jgi:hypothetical protein
MPASPSAARQAIGLVAWVAALLIIAALGGGWLALGRVDPLLTVPGAGWAAMVGALISPMRPGMRLGGACLLSAALILTLVQWAGAGWVDWVPGLIAALVAAGLLLPAWMIAASARERAAIGRYLLFGLMALCAWGWQLAASAVVARAYDPAPMDSQPRVMVVTSLPLFAASRGDFGAVLSGDVSDAPAINTLRRHFQLVPLADVNRSSLAEGDALLLAHPGALAPEALVAIDNWVRSGGRAVVLADALLEAEPPHPLGDPRNPPVSTMLDPLLTHWGVGIAPARPGLRVAREGGQRLLFASAGDVTVRSSSCRRSAGGIVARCRIGRGQAVILGDADMLDPAHWSMAADPFRPVSWHSANMSWIASQLLPHPGRQNRSFARPVWTR